MLKQSLAFFIGTMIVVGSSLYITATIAGEKTIAPEEMGIRKQSVFTEQTQLPEAKYPDTPPGTGKKFSRAYPTAPPQIPHSIKDFLPITAKENACLNCHMPDVAKDVGATPIPPSHFKRRFSKTGKPLYKIAGANYYCVSCHTPQANVKPPVENVFGKK